MTSKEGKKMRDDKMRSCELPLKVTGELVTPNFEWKDEDMPDEDTMVWFEDSPYKKKIRKIRYQNYILKKGVFFEIASHHLENGPIMDNNCKIQLLLPPLHHPHSLLHFFHQSQQSLRQ